MLNTGEYELFVEMSNVVSKNMLTPREIVNAAFAVIEILNILKGVNVVCRIRRDTDEEIKEELLTTREAYDRAISPDIKER